MQHTLLPVKERRALRREYRIRVLIVLLFMLSLAFLIGIGSLFPAFTRALSEERSIADSIASVKKGKNDSGLSKIEKELSADGALLAALQKDSAGTPLSVVADNLSDLRGPIKLTSFSIARSSAKTVTAVIQGTAPTRDDLLSFKDRLEKQLPGSEVELPISELARSSNIQFSIEIVEPLP